MRDTNPKEATERAGGMVNAISKIVGRNDVCCIGPGNI